MKSFVKISKIAALFFSAFLFCFALGSHNARAAALKEEVVFKVDPSYDYSGRSEVTATLRYVGEHSSFYVADDWWQVSGSASAEQQILDLMHEFDGNIYPTLTHTYGSEWSPGIDNNSRIIILITRMTDMAGGYFNSADEFYKTQVSSSNEREMIYMNSTYINFPIAKSFLAHEFAHMIIFYQKNKLRNISEEIWLNEALAEYTSTLCGYDQNYGTSNLKNRVAKFLSDPSDSLTEWGNQAADYGPVNLFMQYFVDHYNRGILGKIVMSNTVGIASIDQVLKDSGYSENFSDVFADWSLANYLNDCRIGGLQKYCYLNQNLSLATVRVIPTLSEVVSPADGILDISDSIKDWSVYWYEFLPSNGSLNLGIKFSGDKNTQTDFRLILLTRGADGSVAIKLLASNGNQEILDTVAGFGGDVKSVILIPISEVKKAGFFSNEPLRSFFVQAAIIPANSKTSDILGGTSGYVIINDNSSSSIAIQNPGLPDGTLIRASNDYKVYIINGQYRRWLQSPEIFRSSHFDWAAIKEISPAVRDFYKDSWLIRADGDYKVYEINGDTSKHWLNMDAENFVVSGRSWDMVYVVNKAELNLYKMGAAVIL